MFQWRYLPKFIADWLYAIWVSFFPPKEEEDDPNSGS